MHLCSTSTELFAFLSLEVVRLPLAESNELYATDGSGVLCSPAESYCARLSPCSQEEADTRLLLDAADAVQKGCKSGPYLPFIRGDVCGGFVQQDGS